MINFILKRLLYGLFVLLGVTVIVFFLFNGLADPARLTQGQNTNVETLENIKKELGLDKPLGVQFAYYLNDLSPLSIHASTDEEVQKYHYTPLFKIGNNKVFALKKPYLRSSYQSKRPVWDVLADALPYTLLLGFTAMLLATFLGVALGILAAIKHRTFADNAILLGSVLGISQPSYFSGILLALIFGYWLRHFTGLDYVGNLYEYTDFGERYFNLKSLILPALALGIRPIAIIMQLTRSAMLDVLSQDYIRTAYAKGLSQYAVLTKHALRNALNPVVTAVSGWLVSVLTGAYFIEVIFDYKGLGYITIKALENFDFPVAMGSILFAASLFVLVSIITDIVYGFLDPRISIK